MPDEPAFRRWLGWSRPPLAAPASGLREPGTYAAALPLLLFAPAIAVDRAHTQGGETAAAVAVAAAVARTAYALRARERPAVEASEPFAVPEPAGEPGGRFRPDRRTVLLVGALDGLFGHVGWESGDGPPWWAAWLRGLGARGALLVGSPAVGIVAADALLETPLSPGALLAAALGPPAVVLGVLVVAGVVHSELAFGRVEYRLYDDAVVAYDRRLDTAQLRIPLDAIRDATADRGLAASPSD